MKERGLAPIGGVERGSGLLRVRMGPAERDEYQHMTTRRCSSHTQLQTTVKLKHSTP